jgi:hypothetical protein
MNDAIIQRGLDSQSISPGREKQDVFPADYRDVFTAARANALRSEAPEAELSKLANNAGL